MIKIFILVSVGCTIGFLLAIILLSRQRPVRQRVWETGTIPVWLPSTSWKESKRQQGQQEQKKSLNHSNSQRLIASYIPQTKRRGKPLRKPVAILSVKGGKYDGNSWLVREGTAISIGRFDQCNIVLDEQNIAPLHAQITHRQNSNSHKFAIFDYSANNKTFVNGERVTAVSLLEDGAQIQIGNTDLIFQRVKQG